MSDPDRPVTKNTEKDLEKKSTGKDLTDDFKKAARNLVATQFPSQTGEQPQGAAVPTQTSGPPPQPTPPPAQNPISSPPGAKFQVLSLTPGAQSWVEVGEDQPDSDDEGDTVGEDQPDSDHEGDTVGEDQPDSDGARAWSISLGGINFDATVQFAGEGAWKIGWVQTAESADFWVLYQNAAGAARHRRRLPNRMKDGDVEECWYGDESCEVANPAAPVTVSINDDPNISFCYPHHPGGSGLEALSGKAPTGCGGWKEFWTWLVAAREGAPAEMVYLHHIHWHVVFDCAINPGGGQPTVTPTGGGVFVLGQGAGQGEATPVLDGPPPRPHNEVNTVEPQ